MLAEFKELVYDHDGPLQPERASRWLAAYYNKEALAWLGAGFIGRSLRREGRITELLALHADLPLPAGPQAAKLAETTHMLAWEVLLLPEPPLEAVDSAVTRVEWVLDNAEFKPGSADWTRAAVQHTLALGKLRQGQFAVVEAMCQPILAEWDLAACSRATVLATIVLARKAAGQPYEQLLAEAVALAPNADLVQEAAGNRQLQLCPAGINT